MANAIYPLYKQSLLAADSNSALTGTGSTGLFVALVSSAYTYSSAHQFYSSLTGVIGTDQEITSETNTTGLITGANVTFSAVASGTVAALVFYRKNAGANTTWRLVAYTDTSVTGLPFTASGGDITITWSGSGIIQL